MTVSYGEARNAVDAARARIVTHAMRFAEYSVDGAGLVAYDVLPEMVKSCEEFSAAQRRAAQPQREPNLARRWIVRWRVELVLTSMAAR